MPQYTQQTAEMCVAHLAQEAALLGEFQSTLTQMRDAIMDRNLEQLEALPLQYERVVRAAGTLATARKQLRTRIALSCQVPERAATVSCLAEACDLETRNSLLQAQSRIRRACEHLNGLSVSTGNLTYQLMQLIDNVFRALNGEAPQSPLYQRSGRPRIPSLVA